MNQLFYSLILFISIHLAWATDRNATALDWHIKVSKKDVHDIDDLVRYCVVNEISKEIEKGFEITVETNLALSCEDVQDSAEQKTVTFLEALQLKACAIDPEAQPLPKEVWNRKFNDVKKLCRDNRIMGQYARAFNLRVGGKGSASTDLDKVFGSIKFDEWAGKKLPNGQRSLNGIDNVDEVSNSVDYSTMF